MHDRCISGPGLEARTDASVDIIGCSFKYNHYHAVEAYSNSVVRLRRCNLDSTLSLLAKDELKAKDGGRIVYV